MRIVELNLVRYGPFTSRTLSFEPAARLHIVYGQNEAGKSCSLAAITDLFFGIEPRTRFDFLHEAKELRVGATIEARDGSRLTFQRRKGNKNTLLSSTGTALGEDALLPFLGSLSREVFCHAFGLNTGALRAGAEEMLRSEGEVGASLFAAASGLRGLTDLRRTLEEEADGIFAPRASKDRTFYQALERFETARKAIRDLELKAGDWKALNSRISELGERLEQIKVERGRKTVEQGHLSRLKRVAPLLRQIDSDIEALAGLIDIPELPAGFATRLRIAIESLTEANDASKRASGEHDQAKQTLLEISVAEPLIAKSAEIQRLFGETAAYARAVSAGAESGFPMEADR
jgi:chromosome segregation protein